MLSDLQRMMSPATADGSADLAASAARVFGGIKSLHVVCKTGVRPESFGMSAERQLQKDAASTAHGISSGMVSLACTPKVKQSVGVAERMPSARVAFACAAHPVSFLACATLLLQQCASLASASKAGQASMSAGIEDAVAGVDHVWHATEISTPLLQVWAGRLT